MKTTMKKFVMRKTLCLLLGLGLLLQTGCALLLIGGGAAAGIGGYIYVKGELKVTESAPLDRVWESTLAVIDDLKFPVKDQRKDSLTGELTACTAQNKKVHINLKKLTDDTTEIRIRVGAFGDEALSLLIEDKIKKKL